MVEHFRDGTGAGVFGPNVFGVKEVKSFKVTVVPMARGGRLSNITLDTQRWKLAPMVRLKHEKTFFFFRKSALHLSLSLRSAATLDGDRRSAN